MSGKSNRSARVLKKAKSVAFTKKTKVILILSHKQATKETMTSRLTRWSDRGKRPVRKS